MEGLYAELKARYNLPGFGLMDHEFEVSGIEEENFLLRSIRRKMMEKVDFCIKLLDDILHPDAGFASYRESNIFDEADREKLVKTYMRLMFFARLSTELSIDDSDDDNARFIIDLMGEWPVLKGEVLFFVRKMKLSWQEDVTKKEVVRYLG